MKVSGRTRRGLKRYVKEVDRNLGGYPRDQRREIRSDVESHIYAALENRASGEVKTADLEAVLEEMGPPVSYAAPAQPDSAKSRREKARKRQWSPLALAIGAGLVAALVGSIIQVTGMMLGYYNNVEIRVPWHFTFLVPAIIFFAMEIAAVYRGCRQWRTLNGKAGVILALLFILAGILSVFVSADRYNQGWLGEIPFFLNLNHSDQGGVP